jgi:hypothetical protein
MRWLWWFLLAPQAHLLAGVWRDLGLPGFDMGAVWCLFLAFFAQRPATPWLLLGAALSRALVDEASLAIQVLVLGIPVAVLLPLRAWFFGRRWLWQALAAAACAFAVPRLAALFGAWFAQPSAGASADLSTILWTAAVAPPLLAALRRVPPCRGFEDRA